MELIKINENISCIQGSDDPLSSDVAVIETENGKWLFDLGNSERIINRLDEEYSVVISHFHADHLGNLEKIDRNRITRLFVSRETLKHSGTGILVNEDIVIDGIHIFPLPSTHAKGCLGLETEDYIFTGDALGGMLRNGQYVYNAQLLKETIDTLKRLKAPRIIQSHRMPKAEDRLQKIEELEEIYRMRNKNEPYITVRRIDI